MNLDIQPDTVTILIHADSIQHAVQQLVRAKVALQTMIVPAPLSAEELQALLADLAGRLQVGQAKEELAVMDIAQDTVPAPLVDTLSPVEEPQEQAGPTADVGTDALSGEIVLTEPDAEEPAHTDLPPLAALCTDLHRVGQDLFGQAWTQALPWLVKRYTTKFTADHVREELDALSAGEVADLISRLVANAAAFQEAWAEQQAAEQPKTKRRVTRRTQQKSAAQRANHEQMAHPANVVDATG